ncbi:hypothetical protein OS493_024506 [Desmophyllum pertusum]|uniref:Uncharacterized protein n=1 Tax=Desmophyllum pertusum TaxID=174260 RepID=A0A9W9YAA4_9CNID|nr:hypothetical protein OS493_024506 [Desmophyllum pertusum]
MSQTEVEIRVASDTVSDMEKNKCDQGEESSSSVKVPTETECDVTSSEEQGMRHQSEPNVDAKHTKQDICSSEHHNNEQTDASEKPCTEQLLTETECDVTSSEEQGLHHQSEPNADDKHTKQVICSSEDHNNEQTDASEKSCSEQLPADTEHGLTSNEKSNEGQDMCYQSEPNSETETKEQDIWTSGDRNKHEQAYASEKPCTEQLPAAS